MFDHQIKRNNEGKGSLAVYPGSFDPITEGHVDIIHRALNLYDRLIIAVGINPAKNPIFTFEERLEMIKECFEDDEDRIDVEEVDGLIVDYAHHKGAKAIIRGLRAVSDFEFEFQLALMNRRLEREVETIFLMTGFRWIYISSSIIKDAARHGGDISGLVPDHVHEKLREKFRKGKFYK